MARAICHRFDRFRDRLTYQVSAAPAERQRGRRLLQTGVGRHGRNALDANTTARQAADARASLAYSRGPADKATARQDREAQSHRPHRGSGKLTVGTAGARQARSRHDRLSASVCSSRAASWQTDEREDASDPRHKHQLGSHDREHEGQSVPNRNLPGRRGTITTAAAPAKDRPTHKERARLPDSGLGTCSRTPRPRAQPPCLQLATTVHVRPVTDLSFRSESLRRKPDRRSHRHDHRASTSSTSRPEIRASRSVDVSASNPSCLSAQRTRFQLRRPSERESGVCCKPLLGGPRWRCSRHARATRSPSAKPSRPSFISEQARNELSARLSARTRHAP
jgi:hypothetical protein